MKNVGNIMKFFYLSGTTQAIAAINISKTKDCSTYFILCTFQLEVGTDGYQGRWRLCFRYCFISDTKYMCYGVKVPQNTYYCVRKNRIFGKIMEFFSPKMQEPGLIWLDLPVHTIFAVGVLFICRYKYPCECMMGGFSSKNFKDLLEEDVPPTPPVEKRTLEEGFDPRSPSGGIPRTPIQVDKTPDLLLDPRSPTSGITRTPIYSTHEAAQTASEFTQL